jgi:hypothetical protein
MYVSNMVKSLLEKKLLKKIKKKQLLPWRGGVV